MCGETRNLVGGKTCKIENHQHFNPQNEHVRFFLGLRLEPKTKNGISKLCIPGVLNLGPLQIQFIKVLRYLSESSMSMFIIIDVL